MPYSRPLMNAIFSAALFLSFLSSATFAQSTNRHTGSPIEVTADPLVQRPHKQPCMVPLFADFTFAFFSDTEKNFPFTPPSDCSGPFEKIVLEINFSENPGVQFDRTASLFINNANIYFGTTPEPLQTDTNTWHVERDITDYASLLAVPQTGAMILQNCTTDCPPPFNTELNGIFTVNADIEFYPQKKNDPQVVSPDQVLPLIQINSSGGVNLPANVSSPTDQYSTTFTLPENIERVYLDVVSQSQSTDEQWYACFPNDLAGINQLFGCGNTDFRETEITIDGTPAGLAPVSPWVFTGFLPDQWFPMPALQTLDFVPYRVNLTPFAGMLNDGNPHTVAISIFNDGGFFSESANLLLFLDHGSTQVTGEITKNNLAGPSPVVIEHLHGTSTVKGTIAVRNNRKFTIAGFVNTSHGKVSTSIFGQQKFASSSLIDFDVVNFTVLNQTTTVNNSVDTTTTVVNNGSRTVTKDTFSFPITVDVKFPVDSAPFGLTVDTTQLYQATDQVTNNGLLTWFSSATNNVEGSDVAPDTSSQTYSSFDSAGDSYNCSITSSAALLKTVSRGCK